LKKKKDEIKMANVYLKKNSKYEQNFNN